MSNERLSNRVHEVEKAIAELETWGQTGRFPRLGGDWLRRFNAQLLHAASRKVLKPSTRADHHKVLIIKVSVLNLKSLP